MKINVICVKWGDKFSSDFVNRLHTMVQRNLTYDFDFYCYTDDESGIKEEVNIIKIPEDNTLEVYWNKVPMFKKGMFEGMCLLFDLDVVIQNNIDELIDCYQEGKLTAIKISSETKVPRKEPLKGARPRQLYFAPYNSSTLLWKAEELTHIWDHFSEDYDYWIVKYFGMDRYLYHEHVVDYNHFPQDKIYSRLYGIYKDRGGKISKYETGGYKLHYYPDFSICIFNGYGKVVNPNEGTHLDDKAYKGFERYWQ